MLPNRHSTSSFTWSSANSLLRSLLVRRISQSDRSNQCTYWNSKVESHELWEKEAKRPAIPINSTETTEMDSLNKIFSAPLHFSIRIQRELLSSARKLFSPFVIYDL